MGICVIEETQLCVHTHSHAHARQYVSAHSHTRTLAHFPGPAGVLISPRGCVSVDPKTL